jgi:hypothetical protein
LEGELMSKGNHIATALDWRAAKQAEREARAEPLLLPSGATILAARPDPLEWIISGRIPQGLLAVALEDPGSSPGRPDRELTREEIIDLAKFAARLVVASVVDPPIGDGPDELPLEEIPLRDRAYIFEWACRGLGGTNGNGSAPERPAKQSAEEELSSVKLEGFRPE